MTCLGRYQAWLNDPLLDDDLRRELLAIADDDAAIKERFYGDIEFGTAGLRGVLGAGSMMMNTYNVKLASEAVSRVLLRDGTWKQGVVIAYDSRNRSHDFALATALVLCGNSIPVYLFPEISPVPLLSYAIRHFGCAAGIAITASHNPAQYNGYKAYAAYGGQLAPVDCDAVLSYMKGLTSLSDVAYTTEKAAKAAGLLHEITEELYTSYYNDVLGGLLCPDALKNSGDLSIVYTPLFGSGNRHVQSLLGLAGFTNVHIVKEQEQPNGDFPGLKAPNPEEEDALKLAIACAKEHKADIVLATDPDSDRLAIAIPVDGAYVKLTGNQAACLLLYYRLGRMAENGTLPKDALIVRSIVSTSLADRIAAAHGLKMTEVLTGFRYVSQQMDLAEKAGIPFLYGFEESYGYLAIDLSRDKDAVSSALYLCEAACYYRSLGKSLYDVMEEIYQAYGYQEEGTATASFPGADGSATMAAIMADARSKTPDAIAGLRVLAVRDYQTGLKTSQEGESILDYPKSNVLFYELEGGSWACLRPSGTEPKLKIYASAVADSKQGAKDLLAAIISDCKEKMGL